MPKRELSKCREWERERRERLKTCFDALARLLPSHDPTITPSKLEILQRAAAHITDLQQKNKELLLGDQRSTAIAQRDEVRRLRDRVKKLNVRSEQLAGLLRTAGLKVPKECVGRSHNVVNCQSGVFKGPPRLWSGRLTREKAEILRKQHENESPQKRKRKHLTSKKSTNSSENTDPLAPPAKKTPKLSSPNVCNTKKSHKKQHTTLSTSSSSSLASKVATVLGPGTLILANGSVVPVPAPVGAPTLHRIQIVPAQSNSVILNVKKVSTSNTTSSINTVTNKLPTLRPKTAGNSRQNVLTAKIAIPALPKKKVCVKKQKSTTKSTVSTKSRSVITTNNIKKIAEKNCSSSKTDSGSKSTELNEKQSKNEQNSQENEKNTNKQQNIQNISNVTLTIPEIITKKDDTKKQQKINLSDNNLEQEPLLKPQTESNTLLHLSTDPPSDPTPQEVIQSEPEHLHHHDDHSELSNDIFASLGAPGDSSGVIGGQHTESMSPTAAFLLAFPLVSTLTGSRIADPQGGNHSVLNNSNNNNSDRNNSEDDRQSTPTTLLQIGGTMTLDNNKIQSRTIQIEDSIALEHSTSSKTLLQIGNMNLDNSKNSSRTILHQIDDTIALEHSRSSKTLLQIGNIDLDNSKNNSRSVLQIGNIDNKNSSSVFNQIDDTIGLEHSRSSKTLLQIGNMDLDNNKNSSRTVLQLENIDNNKNLHQIENTIALEHSRTSKTLLQIGNMDLNNSKNSSRNVLQLENIDTNKNMNQIENTIALEESRSSKTLLQIGNIDLDNSKNSSRSVLQIENIDNNKNLHKIESTIALEQSRSSKTLLQIGNMDLDNSKNSSRTVLQLENIDNNKNMNQIENTIALEQSRSSKTLLQIGNMDLDTNKNSSGAVLQLGNIDNNKSMNQMESTIALEQSRSSKTLLQIGNMDLDNSKISSRAVLQIGNIDNNKNLQQIENTIALEHSRTSKTLLQIGNMGLDNSKNSSRTVPQIGNIDNHKNMHQIGDTIGIEHSRNTKSEMQHLESGLKPSRNDLSRSLDTFGFFRDTQNYNNQQINTTNSYNRDYVENKDPLISSVLQVSHACLYEQRNQHQNTNFYPSFPEIRGDHCQINNQTYNNCQTKESNKNSSKNRNKQQHQRPPVNWMTTPDIRTTYSTNEHQSTPTTSGMTSDYFLPPFSDVYSGISSAISSENNDPNFSWTGANRSVLPTLLGDLALGVTSINSVNTTSSVIYTNTATKTVASTNNQYYPFDPTISSHVAHQVPQMPQTPQIVPQSQSNQQQNKDSFLSVSSILVGQKSRKNHQQNNQNNSKRHREKSKSRNDANFEGHKKYGGGYSAEELIGDSQNTPANISSYSLTNLQSSQQSYHHSGQNLPQNGGSHHQNTHQNNQHPQSSSRQNQSYINPNRQQGQQQQQGPFGANYPTLPSNHGEFSALLSAAVVDTYSKTFDSFVHVKPPTVPPNGGAAPAGGFDGYCTTPRNEAGHGHHRSHNSGAADSDRRRHSRRSGAPTTSRDSLVTNVVNTAHTNTAAGFSELSFLSMSGAVNSPILPDDFHAAAPFITSAPPPIPTPVSSSLTNFNLSAIFPEINKGAAVSSAPSASAWPHSKPPVSTTRSQTRYQHQNQQLNNHQSVHQHSALPPGGKLPGGYCHPQQHGHNQQLPHEGIYGGGAPAQSFPGILGHHQVQNIGTGSNTDVTTAPTNFSFSFATP